MSFFRRAGTNYGLLLARSAPYTRSVTFGSTPPDPPDGDLTVAVLIEYVDAAGVRQSIDPLAEGAPTITGVAPLLMTIDATGTRAHAAFAAYAGSSPVFVPSGYPATVDQEAKALEVYSHLTCRYRITYDGGTGSGNWAYPEGSGGSKNEDGGAPIWPACFREVGTHTVSIRTKDAIGNDVTVSFDVVVTAPPAATNIPVSAGAWPTFSSGSRYTLDAGGDYRSFGDLNTADLHNLIIERAGAGADPRITTWNIDPRDKFTATTMYPTRARHVRLVGIDMDLMQEGSRGFDFCGAIDGRTRRYSEGNQRFGFHEGNANVQSACRYSRGCFFVGGELNNIGRTGGYTLFGTWNALHLIGCLINAIDIGTATWLVLRTYGTKNTVRHCKFKISHAENTGCGTFLSLLGENGVVETQWPSTDRAADIDSSEHYGLVCEHSTAYRCQFGDADSGRANAIFSSGGNPSGTAIVRPYLVGLEDCVWYESGNVAISVQELSVSGRGVYVINCRKDMGAGDYLATSTNDPNDINNPGNLIHDWHGPYHRIEASTRAAF